MFIYLLVAEEKKTDSNEILNMEDKERLYHEILRNEFAFAKGLAKVLSGGKENIALEKKS